MTLDERLAATWALLRSYADWMPTPVRVWTPQGQIRGEAPGRQVPCSTCDGLGRVGKFTCRHCQGRGALWIDPQTEQEVASEEQKTPSRADDRVRDPQPEGGDVSVAMHYCDECHVVGGHLGSCSRAAMRSGEPYRLARRAWFYRWEDDNEADEWVETLRAFVGDPVNDRDRLVHEILWEVELLDRLAIPRWRHKLWRRRQHEALENLRRVADQIMRTGGTARV